MIEESYVLFIREVKKWVGRKPVLIVSLITPLCWVLLFGKSFNIMNVFDISNSNLPSNIVQAILETLRERIYQVFGTRDYFTYVASGMLVVFALFQGVLSGASVIFDKRLGYMTRLMASPIRRESIFISKVLATVFRTAVLSTLLLMVAYIAGFKFKEDLTIVDLLGAGVVLIAISMVLVSIFMPLGFMTDNTELLFAVGNLLNLPLMFASNVLVPVDQMPEWLRAIAKINPLTYGADVVRFFLIGKPLDNAAIIFTFLVAAAIVLFLAMMVVSVRILERG